MYNDTIHLYVCIETVFMFIQPIIYTCIQKSTHSIYRVPLTSVSCLWNTICQVWPRERGWEGWTGLSSTRTRWLSKAHARIDALTNGRCSRITYMYMYMYIVHICCSAQTGQHERCKRECCPVWVLQQICWTWTPVHCLECNQSMGEAIGMPLVSRCGQQLLVQFPITTVHTCRLLRNVQQMYIHVHV